MTPPRLTPKLSTMNATAQDEAPISAAMNTPAQARAQTTLSQMIVFCIEKACPTLLAK